MNGWLTALATLLTVGASALILAGLAIAARADQTADRMVNSIIVRKQKRTAAAVAPTHSNTFPSVRRSRRTLAPRLRTQTRGRATRPEAWRFASRQAP